MFYNSSNRLIKNSITFAMNCYHSYIIKLGGITYVIEYVCFNLLDLLGRCCGRFFQKR